MGTPLSYNDVLDKLHKTGEYDKLAAVCKRRISVLRAKYGDGHIKVGLGLTELAYTYYEMQDYAKSLEALEEAEQMLELHYGRTSRVFATCLIDQARLCIFLEQYNKADRLLIESTKVEAALPIEHQDLRPSILINYSKLQRHEGNLEEARQSLQDALEWVLGNLDDKSYYIPRIQHHLGEVYWRQNDLQAAEVALRDSLNRYQKLLLSHDADYAMAISLLGIVLGDKGDKEEAISLHQDALSILKNIRPIGHPNIRTVSERILHLNRNA